MMIVYEPGKQKQHNLTNHKIDKVLTVSSLLYSIGLVCIIAGIYFFVHNLSSYGLTMGKYGAPYGTGSIDGKGMVFCGIVIAASGLIFRTPKKKRSDNEVT